MLLAVDSPITFLSLTTRLTCCVLDESGLEICWHSSMTTVLIPTLSNLVISKPEIEVLPDKREQGPLYINNLACILRENSVLFLQRW